MKFTIEEIKIIREALIMAIDKSIEDNDRDKGIAQGRILDRIDEEVEID